MKPIAHYFDFFPDFRLVDFGLLGFLGLAGILLKFGTEPFDGLVH